MKEVLTAVVTSLIASVVFWIIFNYIPDKRRYNKVRPKVEFDIYEIFFGLGGYIRIALEINEYGWSFPMSRVESGQVTQQDFDLWLQNKCLNDSYKFDEMAPYLLSVGQSLAKEENNLREKIERSATYYAFMTADEILILRKISAKLFVGTYDEPAASKEGNSILRPVVYNLSYMAENFYELSKLYLALQKIVWSYKKIDKSINKYVVGDFRFNKARKCYINGDFTGCVHQLNKANQVSPESKQELLFRVYYAMGNLAKAKAALKRYFETATHKSIALTNILNDEIINCDSLDDDIWDMFTCNFTEIEIMEAIAYADKSKAIQQQGIKNAEMIKSYYTKKLEENSHQASARMTARRKHLAECLEKAKDSQSERNHKEDVDKYK